MYVFLDNLRVHYSKPVKEYCGRANIELVYNSAYSSEYNPIERLWAIAKTNFRKNLLSLQVKKIKQSQVHSLVKKSI